MRINKDKDSWLTNEGIEIIKNINVAYHTYTTYVI